MLIPFSRLYLSDANVRKTRSEDDDIQLSADIEARGLLQNLLVTKSKKRGQYAVIAGGRRLRAIGMIIDRGAWPADAEVECKLLEGSEDTAGEASLAENFQRVGMSPAEECRAFRHFIKEGSDIAAVAKRFGLTQRFVEGRLRLANLAVPIFEALAACDITLEIAKAYAATDQHEVQMRVFEQMRHAYRREGTRALRQIAAGIGLDHSAYRISYYTSQEALAGEHVLEADGVYIRISPERFGEPGLAWRNPFWKPPGAVMRKAPITALADIPALTARIARELQIAPPAQPGLI